MIYCTLDGKVAIPVTSDKIKVTYENQYIKDSGSYTYEMTFPMSIPENAKIFNNIHRLDVKKIIDDFEECRLFVDNRLIISGKGTVTNVTNTSVKLQIVGGKSRIKFNSNFEKHYIDEIDYPDVIINKGIDLEGYAEINMTEVDTSVKPTLIMVDLSSSNFIGQSGVAAFNPINDETNDVLSNRISVHKFTKIKVNGVSWPAGKKRAYIYNLAVQPSLMYVIKKVVELEGYTIKINEFDVYPWNRLLIASARRTFKIKEALPHWTSYNFLEEVRKLFNASLVFDEENKTLSILALNELLSCEAVNYDCNDEYSAEYDEDGLANLATSNIEYDFPECAERDWREVITAEVQQKYETKTYTDESAMVTAAEAMTKKERQTTIFRVKNSYWIWTVDDNEKESRTQCGYFNPIIRDSDSDDYIDLNISPAAFYERDFFAEGRKGLAKFDEMPNNKFACPSIPNEKEQSLEDASVDDDGEYYWTVQEAMQGEASDDTTDDDEKMSIMFQAGTTYSMSSRMIVLMDGFTTIDDPVYRIPVTFADHKMFEKYTGQYETASLTLQTLTDTWWGTSEDTIGNYESLQNIDKHHQIVINFLSDDIPSPTSIYIFHNKRYICEKIEIEVNNDSIDRYKTGYFYEIL